jgi:hypothetical protein
MRKSPLLVLFIALSLAVLACSLGALPDNSPVPTLADSPYQPGRTLYGFFPSPPEVSTQGVIDIYKAIGQHADVVLLQQNVPWRILRRARTVLRLGLRISATSTAWPARIIWMSFSSSTRSTG